jgi:hypothetical protein
MFITKEISRNVHIIKCIYRPGWEQWFLLMSDQHHDHPDCNEKLLIKHLDQAIERNAGILSFGDWVCGMQSKFDKRGSKSKIKTEHQVDNYIDSLVESEAKFLSKYAENLVVFARGNHEEALSRRMETDVIQRIVDTINYKYTPEAPVYSGGYGGWVKFQFEQEFKTGGKGNRTSFNLKYRHSGGSLGTVTKGVLGVDRMAKEYPDADIIVTGDNHEEWQMTIVQERLSTQGILSLKEQLHIKLPTYKEEFKDGYAGWHVETNKAPRPLGAVWLRFYYENDTIKMETIRAK